MSRPTRSARGWLDVETGSGDVTVADLKVDELDARTGSGDINATFATQPFGFKARTVSGDIRATVPAGKREYAVVVTSKSGDISIWIDGDARRIPRRRRTRARATFALSPAAATSARPTE